MNGQRRIFLSAVFLLREKTSFLASGIFLLYTSFWNTKIFFYEKHQNCRDYRTSLRGERDAAPDD